MENRLRLPKLKLVFFALFLTFSRMPVRAEGALQAPVLELQSRIEAQITRSMSALIATQLPAHSFEVAARVELSQNTSAFETKDRKESLHLPSGLDYGSAGLREVVENYKQQFQELRNYRQMDRDHADWHFEVQHVELSLGLDPRYDDAYKSQIQDWFTKRVKSDYGSEAVALVNRLKPAPEMEAPPSKIFGWLPFLSLCVLSFAVVIAGALLAKGLRQMGSQKPMPEAGVSSGEVAEKLVRRQTDQDLSPSTHPTLAKSEGVDARRLPDNVDLMGKVIFLCAEMDSRVNELVAIWLTGGRQGALKATLLIDTLVSAKEKGRRDFDAPAILKIPLTQELAAQHEDSIAEAYRELARMPAEERFALQEKIYWDLLITRTLGMRALRRPFDYLNSMNDLAYAEALKVQDQPSKAMALMFADSNKTKLFLETAEPKDREQIVQSLLAMTQISKRKIWTVDSTLRLAMQAEPESREEGTMNLYPRAFEILDSLTAVDEIVLLRKIAPSLADTGVTLKQQYLTLAFVDEWHSEYVAKLVARASLPELVHLITVVPEAREAIFSVCTERVRMMLTDDLQVQSRDEAALNHGMKELRSKWKQVCLSEEIQMSKVISFKAKETLRLAS